MNSPETKEMLRRVEKLTGYMVAVETVSGIYEQARMISARPRTPAHVIQVNENYQQYADSIVAAQCGMLLVLWSDPARVPGFAPVGEKCAFLASKYAKTRQIASLPRGSASGVASYFVESLLKQVNSTPLEIRVTNLCHEACPGLRGMQAELMNIQLRQFSEAFAPENRALAPPEVFQKNASMNAALALNWSRLTGSTLCLLPYESTGYLDTGGKLLAMVDAGGGLDSQAHIRTVDAWAGHLSMAGLYRWEFTDHTK